MKPDVFFLDPNRVFHSHGPTVKIDNLRDGDFYDKDGIGMSNYLHVLTSIGLYGIKYAVPLSSAFYALDGNFRIYAAEELGIQIPVVQVQNNQENRHPFIYKWLWRFRKVIRRKYFLKRKWINPRWKWKNKSIVLVTTWQRNIL